jgi:trans-aconitate methyltransferase
LANHIPIYIDGPTTSLSILEYGCGDGRILRHAPYIHGVDINPDFIQAARQYTPNCWLLKDLPPENRYDVVFSWAVFIHLNDIHTVAALNYIHDKLKRNGLAYIQLPIYSEHTEPKDFIDVRTWSRITYAELLAKTGFEAVTTFWVERPFDYTNIPPTHNKLQVIRPI